METFVKFIENLSEKPILLWALLVISVFIILMIGLVIGSLVTHLKLHSEIKKNRKDAVKRSRSVITGQISEQLAPYLPNFPCSPECVQFLGKPVDFIGFVTSNVDCEKTLEERHIEEIIFIEVKTENAVQTRREKEVQKAIEEGRVRYVVYRAGEK